MPSLLLIFTLMVGCTSNNNDGRQSIISATELNFGAEGGHKKIEIRKQDFVYILDGNNQAGGVANKLMDYVT